MSTRVVRCGKVKMGGDNPVVIQSMTNTDTRDVEKTVAQIKRLEKAGCQVVRVAVVDMDAAKSISDIIKRIDIPLIADIHFDYKLAIESMEQGAHGIRINPGNIGSREKLQKVVEKAKEKDVKIRVGVNGGSLEKEILEKYERPCADALVESAIKNVKIVEEMGFENIVISLKSSSIHTSVEAYRKISKLTDYPLHVGITESGSVKRGTIKSSIGIGILLFDGIGDTIRVSLTGDPVEEIFVAKEMLKSLGLLDEGINLISCPTCGRCQINLIDLVEEIETRIEEDGIDTELDVAVMGCAVNGPGEAKEADIGIAGGKNEGLLFKKGEIVRKIHCADIVEELIGEIKNFKRN